AIRLCGRGDERQTGHAGEDRHALMTANPLRTEQCRTPEHFHSLRLATAAVAARARDRFCFDCEAYIGLTALGIRPVGFKDYKIITEASFVALFICRQASPSHR